MNASTPKRKQTRKASTEALAPITNHEFRIMNCLPGVVERDARPPIFIHNPLIFKKVTTGLQTSLVCTQKKSCLDSKEALFASQTRLLFISGNCILKRESLNFTIPSPSSTVPAECPRSP